MTLSLVAYRAHILARTAKGGTVRCVSYSPKAGRLAAGSFEKGTSVWTVPTGPGGLSDITQAAQLQGGPDRKVTAVALLDGLGQVATGTEGGSVAIWNIESGTRLIWGKIAHLSHHQSAWTASMALYHIHSQTPGVHAQESCGTLCVVCIHAAHPRACTPPAWLLCSGENRYISNSESRVGFASVGVNISHVFR